MNQPKPTLSALLADAFPASAPGAHLADRILKPVPVRKTHRAVRLPFALAGVSCAAMAVVFLAPRASAFVECNRIAAAADALPEWHLETYTPDLNGALIKSGETWCRDGRVRELKQFGQVEVFEGGGSSISYVKGADHAIRNVGKDAASQVKSLSGFVQELKRSKNLLALKVEHDVLIDGRSATRISTESKQEPVRLSIYADPKTDVPFLGMLEERTANGWHVERKVVIDTRTVKPSEVAFDLPKSVQIIEESDLESSWRNKLGKPIAVFPSHTGRSHVAIRDVWMNRDGLIFVMFTNGATPKPLDTTGWIKETTPGGAVRYRNPHPESILNVINPSNLESITDSDGTDYATLGGFQGYETDTSSKWHRGLTWPDGDAQVSVFAPVRPGPGKARELTLKFGWLSYVVKKGYKPKGATVSMKDMVPQENISAVYHLRLSPHGTTMPEWVESIGIAPTELGLQAAIAEVRGVNAVANREGTKAESYAREYLRITRLESATTGLSYQMSRQYDLLGQALAINGKDTEAVEAWKKALDDAQGDEALRIQKEIQTVNRTSR